MRVLVTGGAGFIGSHIVDALVARQHRVVVVDDLSTGFHDQVNQRARFVQADIAAPTVAKLWRQFRPEAVFHLAAQMNVRKSLADPLTDARINILGSLRLIELCRQYPVKKFIFSSTGGALYGDQPPRHRPTPETITPIPTSPYGVAKWTTEQYCQIAQQQWRLPYVALRYANVYGPRQNAAGEAGVVAIFLTALAHQQRPTIFGDGKQTRDFVFVNDVVAANLAALRCRHSGGYNIGTGVETDISQLFKLCARATNPLLKPKFRSAIIGEQRHSALDARLARRELGWRPRVSLTAGITETAAWFKSRV